MAQIAGAFVAAAVVFLNYEHAFLKYSDGQLLTPPAKFATAQAFATYPVEEARPYENSTGRYPGTIHCFFDQ